VECSGRVEEFSSRKNSSVIAMTMKETCLGAKKRQMLITDFIFGRGQRWAQNNKKVVWLAVLLLFSKFTFFVI
jgi:hypothetical protein